jgi:uncharacterized protein with ParB-like and HNH nuclease domain
LTNIDVEKSTDVDDVKSTEVFICIDGQQRLTTTLLLCASLRDAIVRLSINQVLSALDENKKKAGN